MSPDLESNLLIDAARGYDAKRHCRESSIQRISEKSFCAEAGENGRKEAQKSPKGRAKISACPGRAIYTWLDRAGFEPCVLRLIGEDYTRPVRLIEAHFRVGSASTTPVPDQSDDAAQNPARSNDM